MWDHYCVYPQQAVGKVLADASEQGWELVTTSVLTSGFLVMCFKRPHFEATAAPAPATSDAPAAATGE